MLERIAPVNLILDWQILVVTQRCQHEIDLSKSEKLQKLVMRDRRHSGQRKQDIRGVGETRETLLNKDYIKGEDKQKEKSEKVRETFEERDETKNIIVAGRDTE